jgi:hypothetical protein
MPIEDAPPVEIMPRVNGVVRASLLTIALSLVSCGTSFAAETGRNPLVTVYFISWYTTDLRLVKPDWVAGSADVELRVYNEETAEAIRGELRRDLTCEQEQGPQRDDFRLWVRIAATSQHPAEEYAASSVRLLSLSDGCRRPVGERTLSRFFRLLSWSEGAKRPAIPSSGSK